MKHYGLKYVFLVLGTGGFFTNFIACGTQLYQVSVEEDFDQSHHAVAANPKINDPESTMYGIHTISGWKNLPIPYRFDPTLDSSQRKALQAAMAKWEWAVGKKLFSFAGDASSTGDSFSDLYSSLEDDVNGHYVDKNWEKTAKPQYVLATTIWNNSPDYSAITKADIRFNMEYYVIGDSLTLKATESKEVVDMQSLATHELGHLLGLAHVSPEVDRLSIMNPSLLIGEGLTTRHLSRDDIIRIQTVYGCSSSACDIDAMVEEETHSERTATASQTDTSTQAH